MNEFKVLASVKRTLNRNASGCFLRLLNPFSVEMSMRFCERNSKYITALDALDPGSENFMDEGKVKPLLDLMKRNDRVSVHRCTSVLANILHRPGQENDFVQTSFKLLQRFPSQARGSDCPKTRTKIWGFECYALSQR